MHPKTSAANGIESPPMQGAQAHLQGLLVVAAALVEAGKQAVRAHAHHCRAIEARHAWARWHDATNNLVLYAGTARSAGMPGRCKYIHSDEPIAQACSANGAKASASYSETAGLPVMLQHNNVMMMSFVRHIHLVTIEGTHAQIVL